MLNKSLSLFFFFFNIFYVYVLGAHDNEKNLQFLLIRSALLMVCGWKINIFNIDGVTVKDLCVIM